MGLKCKRLPAFLWAAFDYFGSLRIGKLRKKAGPLARFFGPLDLVREPSGNGGARLLSAINDSRRRRRPR